MTFCSSVRGAGTARGAAAFAAPVAGAGFVVVAAPVAGLGAAGRFAGVVGFAVLGVAAGFAVGDAAGVGGVAGRAG